MNRIYGKNIRMIKEMDRGAIYKIELQEKGAFYIKAYHLFSGLSILFFNIHIRDIQILEQTCVDEIQQYEIHHCREGKLETTLRDGTDIYLEPGDLAINPLKNCSLHDRFPIGHCHGVTIHISPSELDEEASMLQDFFDISYNDILDKLCNKERLFLKRATPELQHIFHEIYHVPETIILPYLKVKIQELFLYLSTLSEQRSFGSRAYFEKNNVEVIKRLHQFIIKNSEKNYTYNQLSSIFDIKQTTMKTCYKSVYGVTIHETLRNTRLKNAIYLLKNTSYSITEIALETGYSSHSQFSAIFKKVYNISPSQYKKIVVLSDTDCLI